MIIMTALIQNYIEDVFDSVCHSSLSNQMADSFSPIRCPAKYMLFSNYHPAALRFKTSHSHRLAEEISSAHSHIFRSPDELAIQSFIMYRGIFIITKRGSISTMSRVFQARVCESLINTTNICRRVHSSRSQRKTLLSSTSLTATWVRRGRNASPRQLDDATPNFVTSRCVMLLNWGPLKTEMASVETFADSLSSFISAKCSMK